MNNGYQIAEVILASIGACFVVYWIVKGAFMVYEVIRDLAATLKEAVEVVKMVKNDIMLIRQFASAVVEPNLVPSSEPRTASGQEKESVTVTRFPSPNFDMFKPREPEPDAPVERISQVDVTATDQEISDEDRLEQLRQLGMNTEELEAEQVEKQARIVESE